MENQLAPLAEDFAQRWSAVLDEALLIMGVDPRAIAPPAPIAEVFRPRPGPVTVLRGEGSDALIIDVSELDPLAAIIVEDGPSFALRTGEDTPLEAATISLCSQGQAHAVVRVEDYARLDFHPAPMSMTLRGDFLCGVLRKDAIAIAPTRSL